MCQGENYAGCLTVRVDPGTMGNKRRMPCGHVRELPPRSLRRTSPIYEALVENPSRTKIPTTTPGVLGRMQAPQPAEYEILWRRSGSINRKSSKKRAWLG